MRVIIILAAIALTHGAKLERTYLPPSNAPTAGGSGNFLQTPVSGPSGSSGIPTARNFKNSPAFSQSGNDFSQSGNGFSQSENGFSQPGNDFSQLGNGFSQTGAEFNNVNFNNFAQETRPERPRAALERNAAILRQDSSNDGETFSYAFETENGIYAEENGVATNGVEAQGGYSYTGDDGQVYSVRYTADQNGFVPQGDHLPTPPPVPEEILKALEQNARDEANGIFDDGSYNDGKYSGATNNQYNYQNNAYNGNSDDTIVTNSALARSYNAPSNSGIAPTFGAPSAPAYNTPNTNAGIASTYGAPNARAYNPPSANSGIAPTYGAPNAPAYNAPGANAGIASTYGAPDAVASNTPTLAAPERSSSGIARSYGAPTASTSNAASNRKSYNAPAGNAPVFNTPSVGLARSSATEKAYLPPLADQRGQARNAFGRRQQSFDARTGYNY